MDSDIVIETPKQEEPEELDGDIEVPAADYLDDDSEQIEDQIEGEQNTKVAPQVSLETSVDEGAIIAPKKLVNPCLLSKEHKALRQELKLNHKVGRNPTEKPELVKVLKERQEKEKKKELEQYLKTKRTSFDIRLEEQALKISQAEQQKHQELEKTKNEEEKPEFFKMHQKIIKTKLDS